MEYQFWFMLRLLWLNFKVNDQHIICREWLYEICRGIDHEPVKERHVAQSVGCSKTFRGIEALNTRTKVNHWIGCLATELVERLIRDREIVSRCFSSVLEKLDICS